MRVTPYEPEYLSICVSVDVHDVNTKAYRATQRSKLLRVWRRQDTYRRDHPFFWQDPSRYLHSLRLDEKIRLECTDIATYDLYSSRAAQMLVLPKRWYSGVERDQRVVGTAPENRVDLHSFADIITVPGSYDKPQPDWPATSR